MSKFAFRGIVAASLAVVASLGFSAQETRTLAVTATIPGTCVLSISGPMAFGELNMMAASGTSETHRVTATYKCAVGQTVSSFTVAGSTTGTYVGTMRGLSPNNSDILPYTLTWTDPGTYTGVGFNTTGQQVVLSGAVAQTDYISKKPDSYADSVVIAINY